MVKELMAEPKAIEFNQPVVEKYGKIPDYENLIHEPMDLRTITEKLKSGSRKLSYSTLADWARDVRLVFSNAKTFNTPGSLIYADAEFLSKLFEEKYRELKESLGYPNYDPSAVAPPPPPVMTIPVIEPPSSIPPRETSTSTDKEKEKDKHKSKKSKKKKHKSKKKKELRQWRYNLGRKRRFS